MRSALVHGAVLATVLATTLIAPAAKAQTFGDAVWANMALAVQLCNVRTPDMNAVAQGFRNAGFAERVQRSMSNSDTTHWFTAPADTVVVEFYYGEMPESCTVTTTHQGVGLSSQLLDALIPQLFPGYVRKAEQGPADAATGQPAICVRYVQPGTPIPHVIGVWPGGQVPACVENGTSTINSYSAV